jgi:peptide/nickel transport system permease protein
MGVKDMAAYIMRRVLYSVLVVFVISLIIFFSIRITGDPVAIMFQAGEPSQEAIDKLKQSLGLDRPLYVQYLLFLKGIVTFDLGESLRTGESVSAMIFDRLGATLALALGGIFVALLIAVPVGVISAIKRGTLIDFVGRIFSLIGISFPNFWLGIMLIIIFSVTLGWLPASGFSGPHYLILPSIALGMILAGVLSRLIRSSMLEILNQQYINTARSKGIREWAVIIKHALRTALIPTVTLLGVQLGSLLGGTVIIETVFSWPGVGRLIVDAINQRDYPVVQGGVIILALIMVTVNLIVDISYSLLDPRIKVGGNE